MARRFEGKTAFITGASSGIGAELARQFAAEGARVVVTARRADKLEAVCEAIRTAGGQALGVACDVTDRAALDHAAAEAVREFGSIDVVVANAGFGVSGLFDALTTDDFRRQFEINVFGVVDTIYATIPHLIASRGRLGVVSSILGRMGGPATSAYCASKFAVAGLAESIYYELAEHGVSVTCINPGIVDNENRWKEGRNDPAPSWLRVPAAKACREILDALHRRKFEAVITGHGRLACFVARHFPRTLRFAVRQATKGKLDALGKRKRSL